MAGGEYQDTLRFWTTPLWNYSQTMVSAVCVSPGLLSFFLLTRTVGNNHVVANRPRISSGFRSLFKGKCMELYSIWTQRSYALLASPIGSNHDICDHRKGWQYNRIQRQYAQSYPNITSKPMLSQHSTRTNQLLDTRKPAVILFWLPRLFAEILYQNSSLRIYLNHIVTKR